MAAQERITKRAEVVTGVRERRPSSAWIQTGWRRQGSVIVAEEIHMFLILSDVNTFPNFYCVSTTLPSINLWTSCSTIVRRRVDVVSSPAIVSTC